ncbi:MAG: chromosome partitioning protein ParB, partial [Novosphingobium sp.]|nr:chromosome partitioning protein ParB [Novosphingobium sp.]
DRQRAVFEQMQNSYYGNNPDNIRRAILNGTTKGSDAKARYVGRDAYVAAGGRINADLFSDADCETWIDTDVLDRLAEEKLEAAAAVISAQHGYAFVTPVVSTQVPYDLEQEYHAYYPVRRDPTEEESASLAALEAEANDLVDQLESDLIDGTPEADAANDRIAAIEAEIEHISDGCTAIDPAIRAQLGTFVYIGHDGETRVHSRYYSEKPVIDPNRPIAEKTGQAGEGDEGETDHGPKLSAILVDELATQRRQILAAHLGNDPALALNLTLFLMAQAIVCRHSAIATHSTLRAGHAAFPIFGFRDEGSLASATIAEQLAALDVSWAGYDTASQRFDAFCLLPEESRAAWIGYAIAETLEPTLNVADGVRAGGFHDHLGRLLDIRVEMWWRPSAQNYFGRVKKDVMLAALEEIGGPVLRARYKDAKKGELAKTCESLCSGNGIVEVDVREKAMAWLPDAMRFDGVEQPRSMRMSIADERGNADPEILDDEIDDDAGGDADAEEGAFGPGDDEMPDGAEDDDHPVEEAA